MQQRTAIFLLETFKILCPTWTISTILIWAKITLFHVIFRFVLNKSIPFKIESFKLSVFLYNKVGSFFKKRFTTLSKTVATNRIWLKSTKSSICDVLLTFRPNIEYETIHALLERILKTGLIVNVKYHSTTRMVAFYITATYERFI